MRRGHGAAALVRSGCSTRQRRRFDSGDCAASLLDNLAVIPLLHGHCHGVGGYRGGCATVARRLASDAVVRSSSSRGEERGACTEREYGGLRQSSACDADKCECTRSLV